jgi:hypothetical protein
LSGVSAEVDVTLGIAKEWERFEFNNQGEFMKKVQVALYSILMLLCVSSVSSAQQNTAYGVWALGNNTSGGYNSAFGYQAENANSTGSFNTGIGNNALASNYTGDYNTAVGFSALPFAAGVANTAVGNNAGYTWDFSLLTGMNNTFLGTGTLLGTGGLNNATALGANAEVDESNALVLGSINGVNGQTVSTKVGIGTTKPRSALEVDFSKASGLGPTITLTNPAGGTNAATSLDFNSYAPHSGFYNPAARIESVDASGFTDNIVFQANGYGAPNQGLQTTMTIYSNGNVAIAGNLSKGSGSFKIDHPLDPANKYLYHSFVESPDMMNVYNGNITTNKSGLAVVVLPDYFEALNRDFRYQLTVIGQFAQAIVAKEIGNSSFTIKTSKPGVKVSWQVTGIRHDAYADAHRIQVEEEKPPQEQGHYLHPELFGAPPEQAVGYHTTTSPAQAESDQVSSLRTPSAPLK